MFLRDFQAWLEPNADTTELKSLKASHSVTPQTLLIRPGTKAMQISQKDIRGVPSVSAINSCWHSYQPQAWPGRSSNMVFSCLFMSLPFSDRARNEWRVAFVGRKEHAFCMSKLNLRKETLTFGCADTSSRIPLTFFVFGEFGIPANANKQAHWRHGVLPSSRELDVAIQTKRSKRFAVTLS